MLTRRSFFTRFAAVIAAVALAPEIAFKCETVRRIRAELDIDRLLHEVYRLAAKRAFYGTSETMDIFVDRSTADLFQVAMQQYYSETQCHKT